MGRAHPETSARALETEIVSPVFLAEEKDMPEISSLIEAVKLSTEHMEETSKWYGIRNELGQLIACMGLAWRGDFVYIQSLSVDKAFRKQGNARRLVDRAFAEDLKKGETLIALTLFWNKKIYEKLGFQQMNAAEIKKRDDIAALPKHLHCMALGKQKNS